MVIVLNCFVELVALLSRKGRVTGGELKSIAAVAPDVDLLGVVLSFHDLRTDPIWSSSSRLSLLVRVGEKLTEAQIGDTNFTI